MGGSEDGRKEKKHMIMTMVGYGVYSEALVYYFTTTRELTILIPGLFGVWKKKTVM